MTKRSARRTITLLALVVSLLLASASAQTFKIVLDDSAFDYYTPNTTVYNSHSDRYGKTGYVNLALVDNRLIVALSDVETPGSLRLAKTLAHLPLSRLTGASGEYQHTRGELRDTLESVTFLRGGGLELVFTDAKLHEIIEAYQRFFSDHGFEGNVQRGMNANGRSMHFQNGVAAAQVNVVRNGSGVKVRMASR